MTDISIFKINNLIKLISKGKIHTAYGQMYKTACKLAKEDAFAFSRPKIIRNALSGKKSEKSALIEYTEYIENRVEYHLRNMEKLVRIGLLSKK
jgi:hypothetical protein